MSGPMVEHALAYAAAYRPVFPCNPRPGDWSKWASPRIVEDFS
jgi:hypothetical protein